MRLCASDCRLAGEEKTARFLLRNAVTKLAHLEDVDHPRDWVGSHELEAVELDFVWGLRGKARKRSRWASWALGLAG